jgi:hypothetical protein
MMGWLSFIIRYRIPLAVVAALLAAYGYGAHQHSSGYSKGFAACDAAYIAAEKAANNKSRKGADDVRKKIQALDSPALDAELLRLGIVRGEDNI